MIRRFGESRIEGQQYQIRHGAYGILLGEKDVLLTYQAAPFWEFQLPGGGIDPGESPLQALHREVLEETGWRISQARRVGAYRRFAFMPEYEIWCEKICHIFVARPTRRMGPPLEEGHTDIWVSPRVAGEILSNDGDRNFFGKTVF